MMGHRASVAVSFLIALAVGYVAVRLGRELTDAGAWYHALAKPSWRPPEWIFGPVWLAILVLTAVAASLAWQHASRDRDRSLIILLIAGNLAFATAWSLLFFRLRRPDLALADVALLWASVALLMAFQWRRSRAASLLLTPYLVWVSLAAAINIAIVHLNGPFGGAA